MLQPKDFFEQLKSAGFDYFTGVPDSLLKDFCAYVADNAPIEKQLIAANEGAAIALATGHHLATGRYGVVYMQNSGLGNAVNPLTSLADPEVYSIPMLLMVGWRGEPGKPDEPQHVKQGQITLDMLSCMGIPYELLPDEISAASEVMARASKHLAEHRSPFAIVVSSGTFAKYAKRPLKQEYEMSREAAINEIVSSLDDSDIIVATTGKTSRELFECRARAGRGHSRDFLTVGSMGHASQIALAIAQNKPDRHVFCIDGDGAAIMHLGSMAIIGTRGTDNFKHILINNGAHDSVGGQPTAGHDIDFCAISDACCYKYSARITDSSEIRRAMKALRSAKGPSLLEIMTRIGAREDLGRPTSSPIENRDEFMRNMNE